MRHSLPANLHAERNMKKRRKQTDEDTGLVELSRCGDKDAFARLVVKYQDRIFNALYRMTGNRDDAAELTQETFLKALGGLKKFNEQSRFSTWLWAIALNLSTSKLRRRRVEKTAGVSAASGFSTDEGLSPRVDPPAPGRNPVVQAQDVELRAAIEEALRSLDEDHRQVVVLRDIEKMDYEQIARALDLPEGTVKSRLHRARLALRAKLEKFL